MVTLLLRPLLLLTLDRGPYFHLQREMRSSGREHLHISQGLGRKRYLVSSNEAVRGELDRGKIQKFWEPNKNVIVPQGVRQWPTALGLKRQGQLPDPERTDGWRWPQIGAVVFHSGRPKDAGEARGMNLPVSRSSNPSLGTPNHRSQPASP